MADDIFIAVKAQSKSAETALDGLIAKLQTVQNKIVEIKNVTENAGLGESARNAAGDFQELRRQISQTVSEFKNAQKAMSKGLQIQKGNPKQSSQPSNSIPSQVPEPSNLGDKDINPGLDKVPEEATKANSALAMVAIMAKKLSMKMLDLAKNVTIAVGKAGIGALKIAGNTAIAPIRKLGSTIDTLGKKLTKLGKMMGLMVKRKILQAFIKNIIQGFKNVIQYSEQTNASVSMLYNSMKQLGNSVAAATTPLINIFAPALNAIIQKIIEAVNWINQLLSLLTGATSWTKAVGLSEDYAKNLEGAAGSAKKLKDATIGIDELNVINDNNLGGGGGATDPKDMFTTADFDQAAKDFADRLKKSWELADFTWLGQLLGEKINKALAMLDNSWPAIREFANRFAKSLATFLNGAIETIDWNLAGKQIAEGVNTAFEAVNTFVENFHWDSLGTASGNFINGITENFNWDLILQTALNIGTSFATALNNSISTIDWRVLGQSIGNGFNIAINYFYGLLHNFDFVSFGTSLGNLLTNAIKTIDWKRLGETISDGFKGLLKSLISFIENLDAKTIADAFLGFLGSIDWGGIIFNAIYLVLSAGTKLIEIGNYIVAGILEGIISALGGFFKWAKEHVLDPIIDGFKSAFGIRSPAETTKPIGENILLGILEGFTSKIGEMITKIVQFKDEVVAKAKEIVTNIKNEVVEKWNFIRSESERIWNELKEKVATIFETLKTELFQKVAEVVGKLSDAWDEIKKAVEEKWTAIKEWILGIWEEIKGLFNPEELYEKGKALFDRLWDGLIEKWNSIKEWISGVAETISGVFDGVVDGVTDFFSGDKEDRARGGYVDHFAMGGFPGQNRYSLFTAGEGGVPEMLGTVGGRSAVAGGAEITGIRQSVEQTGMAEIAVMQTMVSLLSEIASKDTTINLDGRMVNKQLSAAQRRSGFAFN